MTNGLLQPDAAHGAVDLRALAATGTVHFVGIAGAGMSAIAELVLRGGGHVSGCDTNPGPVGAALSALGARVERGHDPAHVQDAVAVVVTAAVPATHPELELARRRGVPVLKRAQALGALVNRGHLIAVAGTHGKTTTTAMTTAILAEAGLDPTAFVGGHVSAWGSGLRSGSDSLFVVEADEYDRSFMTLTPVAAAITSVEADHLDIYGTPEAVHEAFFAFADLIPEHGLLVACSDDAGARRVLERRPGSLGYGTGDDASLQAFDLDVHGRTTTFAVREDGVTLGTLRLNAPGVHNVRNALAAFALARSAGADFGAAQRALASFGGVARRMQELGTVNGITILDDYAHHPTEIAATLAATRASYPHRRVVAAFQPHLFTRTRDFAVEFGATLAGADAVFVSDVYPAREMPIEGVTGALIARAAERAGARRARYIQHLDDLVHALAHALRRGDVCVAMGAGNIDEAARALLSRLREETP
jgi:UDP-N-acetylmuramate--alanine ligase